MQKTMHSDGSEPVAVRPLEIAVSAIETRHAERLVKRMMDVSISAGGLVVASPLLASIAVAIKVASPGPVLFTWRVVGKDGVPFVGYKFRTMVVDAEAMEAQLQAQNEVAGPAFKIRS